MFFFKKKLAVTEQKAIISHLVTMSKMDGVVSVDELKYIAAAAETLGLSSKEASEVLKHPDKFSLPIEGRELQKYFVITLATVMLADGELDESEGLYFALCLIVQGISKAMVKEYWNEFILENSSDFDKDERKGAKSFRDLSLKLIDDFDDFAKNYLAKKNR